MTISKRNIYLATNILVSILLASSYFILAGWGRDFNAIIGILESTKEIWWTPLEFLFYNSVVPLRYLGFDEVGVVILYQLLALTLFLLAGSKVTKKYWAFFIILIPNFYLASFSTVQAAIAIPAIFLGDHSKTNTERCLFYFLAISFHWFAAVILILKFFLGKLSESLWLPVALLLGGFSPLFFQNTIFIIDWFSGNTIYSSMLSAASMYSLQSLSLSFFICLLLCLSFITYNRVGVGSVSSDTNQNKFLSLVAVCSLSIALSVMGSAIELVFRVLNYALLPFFYFIYNSRPIFYPQSFLPLIMLFIFLANFFHTLIFISEVR